MKKKTTAFQLFLMLWLLLSQLVFAQSEAGIRNAILGKEPEDLGTMDLNGDGKVDVADLVEFIKTNNPTIPVASFDVPQSDAGEGANNSVMVKVNFSSSFSGTLKYIISGTAAQDVDYNGLTGSIPVNGLYAEIPVTVTDDGVLEETVETIVLSLYYDLNENLGYLPGASTDHTIYIYDNDALWNGTIETNNSALHFQMRMIRNSSTTTGTLVTDGYGIIPLNGASHEWPVQNMNLGDTTFNATIEQIAVPQSLTLTGADLTRKLVFQANSQQNDHLVDPDAEIRGAVQEFVTCASAPQFDYTASGTFTLLKQIPHIEPQQPELEDVQ